ncbi:cell division protein FtsZ [Helicobacter mustelae]|uniref:Cell division protein FtsZ n=1 Tax=Helicobacter mustelae (strain ATCC 43772 / CCUG 25715 / CIP 103759 / LMG 18044 / NCTC 12198 / R85-136P) TaxID=679897 RepID=D3UH77_HELM1|nr:cell division protein FtsZ [Helicobacter mustelae]CBG39849.1 cell division protein???ftsZ [Helicobacter mustelae 12198]SQH71358.1 cell division protein FtsZ [Helicobacter mustelae]STP12485.1 cell division protein FtsZ [Helicobacter mustelae]
MAHNQAQFNLTEVTSSTGAKIIAVGVGGGGSNAIAHLFHSGINDAITLIAANTDIQHLNNSPAKQKIKLGEKLTKGLGAGAKPEVGRDSAQESYDTIKEHLNGANIVFVSAGLGGGTGTGAAPIIAQAAQEVGALTIAVVTKPFLMEGNKRTRIAEEGLKELRKHSDGIVVIPNDKLLSIISRNTGIKESFKEVDAVLARAVNGISNIILNQGENDINTDFADLRTIMQHKGLALMGIGESIGEDAALEAVKKAIESPLFDNLSIKGARGALVSFEMHRDYPLIEINQAMSYIHEAANEDADIIFGTCTTENMQQDQVKVTIIATGFEKEIINNTTAPANSVKDQAGISQPINLNKQMIKIVGGEDFNMDDLDAPTWMRNQKD